MTFDIPIFDGLDNRIRRLEIGIPGGWLANPILSDVIVDGQPMIEPSGGSILPILMRNTVFPSVFPVPEDSAPAETRSPERTSRIDPAAHGDSSSPMSAASTIPADFDPLPAHQEL